MTQPHDLNSINGETNKIFQELKETFQKAIETEAMLSQRPASEIIIDDVDLQRILKVSKRQTASLRESKQIAYSQPTPHGKIFYTLQSALDYINSGWVSTISSKRKI